LWAVTNDDQPSAAKATEKKIASAKRNVQIAGMTEPFPRLLLATEFPPNASGGGPAVVRQMLKDWPEEQLFWWSCLPDPDPRFGRKVAGHRVASIPPKLYPHRRAVGFKSWLLENLWTPWAARHLRRTLDAFKPEAIWIIPHRWAVPPLSRVLSRSGIRFHITMQDYMDTRSGELSVGVERSRRLAAMADELYSRAATRDATSHPMIADLQARTGCPAAQMIHAGLEAEDFAWLAGKQPVEVEEVHIAYAGTILVEKEFEHFVKVLGSARSRAGRPVWLHLFGSHSYRSRGWFDPTWVQEHGNLPEPELANALRNCTWGLAPMSLLDDDPRYNRFSFPTKFISYLAAGLPVLTLAHAESSVARTAAAYDVGLCVTSTDPQILEKQLLEMFSLKAPWTRFGPEIVRCARSEFDADRMRKKLYESWFDCARQRRA
jgi:glycosyltransferase involved in cell wall biosynthesis